MSSKEQQQQQIWWSRKLCFQSGLSSAKCSVQEIGEFSLNSEDDLSRREICDAAARWKAKSEQLTSSDNNHSQIQVTQSHFLTLSDVWHKIAYDFLTAFAETRNLRYWEAKSEHKTMPDKNHSQIPVAQSHILTLSHVWHTMAYDFLKAFVEMRNLRYWEAKSER